METDEPHKFPPVPVVEESVDWTYEMRREMQEIVPGLYLGPYSAAMKTKSDYLHKQHITHIVCIRQDLEAHFIRPNFPDIFQYLVLDIADSASENIIRHFPKVKHFLEDCFSKNGKALIHGNAGISRSAALVIAYIMEKYGLTFKDAFLLVQQKRFCISLNERFTQQLKEYEPIYKAKYVFPSGAESGSHQNEGQVKRSFDEMEQESQKNNSMDTSL